MSRCWCGKRHGNGGAMNGKVKHWVMNWKLYQLRSQDKEESREKKQS